MKGKEMGHKSSVARANTTTKSLRTTVPMDIAEELKIKEGDVLNWEIMSREGKKGAWVRKLE